MKNKKLKILTLDLETRRLGNGQLEVISSAIYDGKEYKTFYTILTDYPNPEQLLRNTIDTLVNLKYNNYKIYIHNFSLFDAIFLFKYIANLKKEGYEVNFLKRDNKFISITITKIKITSYINKEGRIAYRKSTEFKLTFYDSFLLLSSSLKKLAEAFNVEGKLNFNVLDNDTSDLNDPNFRNKLLEYNKQDCKALYDVIQAFNDNIQDLFKMSIFDSPTLPSLALKIFKNNYLNHQIPITWYEEYKHFKEAYRGGAVDVYKPHGRNLYCYDVNSLYPSVMKNNLYPIGNCSYFISSIRNLNDIFGIVRCKVRAPKDLYAPILLTQTKEGDIIAPVGTWEGWYCSEELKLASLYGYQIELYEGYHWENKDIIFKEYVDTLYNLRLTYDKTDPRNLICKLLLNALYGKFGMSPLIMEYSIYNNDNLESLFDIEFDDRQRIGDVTIIGRERVKNSLTNYKYLQENKKHVNLLEISTPLAIFTTAYARMHMAELKIKYQDNIYYSDTDSIFLDIPLPEDQIGSKLGLFKLEYKVEEGIFLAPKVYIIKPDQGYKNGKPFAKIKGSKEKDISLDQFNSLLFKDSTLKIKQEKWFRNSSKSEIQILDSTYTLRATDNKREFIFDKDGKIINTKPFILNN